MVTRLKINLFLRNKLKNKTYISLYANYMQLEKNRNKMFYNRNPPIKVSVNEKCHISCILQQTSLFVMFLCVMNLLCNAKDEFNKRVI